MTWRIERTDALALLRELPDQWVQTCIAYPPASIQPEHALAVFAEIRRVLREDGTLWLFLKRGEQLPGELRAQGWISQPPPRWGSPLVLGRESAVSLSLFTKQASYFRKFHAAAQRSPLGLHVDCQARHVQRCGYGREAIRLLVKRCILTSTSPLACGTCGAPYCRWESGERDCSPRCPTCPHHNPRGHCMVLDPFYTPGHGTLEAAHLHKRTFLGITDCKVGDR